MFAYPKQNRSQLINRMLTWLPEPTNKNRSYGVDKVITRQQAEKMLPFFITNDLPAALNEMIEWNSNGDNEKRENNRNPLIEISLDALDVIIVSIYPLESFAVFLRLHPDSTDVIREVTL